MRSFAAGPLFLASLALASLLLAWSCGTDEAAQDGPPVPAPDGEQADGQPADATVEPDSEGTDGDAEPLPDLPLPDEPSPGDEGEIPEGPVVAVSVDGAPVEAGGILPLPLVAPGPAAAARLSVRLANAGTGPLVVESAQLLPKNGDGTPKNVWVTLDLGGVDPSEVLPATLPPGGAPGDDLSFDVVYAPMALDPNGATLRVVSSDPGAGTFDVVFAGPALEPRIRVEPASFVFEEATLTVQQEKLFEVHNDGLTPLVLSSVVLKAESDRFQAAALPLPGALVKALGSPGYKPVVVGVTYQPTFGAGPESASLEIASSDPTHPDVVVPLSTTFETGDKSPCLFSFDGEASGVLDLGDAVSGKVSATVTAKNVGTGICKLTGVTLSGDPEGEWYAVETLQVSSEAGAAPIPVGLPADFAGDDQLAIVVQYDAPGYAVNAELLLVFEDEKPRTLTIPVKGAGPAPCFELGPGSVSSPLPAQFVGAKYESLVREVVIYNCGQGSLALTGATISDIGKDYSEYWSLATPVAKKIVIPPWGIEVLDVSMYATDDVAAPKGMLALSYMSAFGEKSVLVELHGIMGGPAVLPVANPGTPDDYAGAVAGQPVVLDGSDSAASVPPPAASGYTWFLLERPPGSHLMVNGPPGTAQRVVVPDVPGSYSFGLMVSTGGSPALYSKTAKVGFYAAPEPPE